MSTPHLNLFDIKELSLKNDGLGLIEILQSFGALPTEPKCVRNHVMKLTKDDASIDKYKWKCREKQNKKNKNCNYR